MTVTVREVACSVWSISSQQAQRKNGGEMPRRREKLISCPESNWRGAGTRYSMCRAGIHVPSRSRAMRLACSCRHIGGFIDVSFSGVIPSHHASPLSTKISAPNQQPKETKIDGRIHFDRTSRTVNGHQPTLQWKG